MDLIKRSALLKDVEDLKKSPWYNIDNPFIQQGMRECMDMIETQCIKKAPTVDAIPVEYIERTMNRWKEIIGYEESVEALRILIDNWKIERKEE